MIVFNDILGNLDDENIIKYSYFSTEIAKFENLMVQPSPVPNTIIAKDVIGSLIRSYYYYDRAIKLNKYPGLENYYTRCKNAYEQAVIYLIRACNSLEISLPYSFIKKLEGEGDYWFTSMMKGNSFQEEDRDKHEEHKTEEISTLKDYIRGDEDNKNSVLNSLREAFANKEGINKSEQLREHFIPLISEKTFSYKPPYKIFNNEFSRYISRSLYNKLLNDASKPTKTPEKLE
jgi:hypothetical protein